MHNIVMNFRLHVLPRRTRTHTILWGEGNLQMGKGILSCSLETVCCFAVAIEVFWNNQSVLIITQLQQCCQQRLHAIQANMCARFENIHIVRIEFYVPAPTLQEHPLSLHGFCLRKLQGTCDCRFGKHAELERSDSCGLTDTCECRILTTSTLSLHPVMASEFGKTQQSHKVYSYPQRVLLKFEFLTTTVSDYILLSSCC